MVRSTRVRGGHRRSFGSPREAGGAPVHRARPVAEASSPRSPARPPALLPPHASGRTPHRAVGSTGPSPLPRRPRHRRLTAGEPPELGRPGGRAGASFGGDPGRTERVRAHRCSQVVQPVQEVGAGGWLCLATSAAERAARAREKPASATYSVPAISLKLVSGDPAPVAAAPSTRPTTPAISSTSHRAPRERWRSTRSSSAIRATAASSLPRATSRRTRSEWRNARRRVTAPSVGGIDDACRPVDLTGDPECVGKIRAQHHGAERVEVPPPYRIESSGSGALHRLGAGTVVQEDVLVQDPQPDVAHGVGRGEIDRPRLHRQHLRLLGVAGHPGLKSSQKAGLGAPSRPAAARTRPSAQSSAVGAT